MNIVLVLLLLLCVSTVPSLVVLTAEAPWTTPLLTGPVLGALIVALVLWLTPSDTRPFIYRPQGFTMTLPRVNTTALLRFLALMGWCWYLIRITRRAL